MSALALTNAQRTYGELRALNGLTLTVEPGEIHAIVGLNGAGKTTAMKALVGQTRLDAGAADVLGRPVAEADSRLAQLGHMIDTPFGYPELTVTQNIAFAARLHGLARGHADAAAALWVERLELERWAGRETRGLSLGNRQRLGLACVTAHQPDALILDEPTNALDPAGVLLLRDLVVEAAERGAAVLVSSHHLDEVARTAHRITVIHAGQNVGSLSPSQVDLERAFFEMVRSWDATHPTGEAA